MSAIKNKKKVNQQIELSENDVFEYSGDKRNVKVVKPEHDMKPKKTVELRKNSNRVDTSIVNINDPHFRRHPEDKHSCYYGFTPLDIYGDTNHAQKYDDIYAVKKYSKSKFMNAYKCAVERSNELSKQAAQEYERELEKIELLKQKNLVIARINSLRLLNKAVLLEKRYYETKFEFERHKSVLEDIKRLKPVLLEQNDIDLKETLAKISLDREIALSNNVIDRNKALARIEEKKEVIEIKRKWRNDRVRTLSAGKKFDQKLGHKEFDDVRRRYAAYEDLDELKIRDVESIATIFNNLDRSKLSSQERAVIDKFIKLRGSDSTFASKIQAINDYSRANEIHRDKIRNYRERLQNNIKDRKYMIISSDAYQRILSAKKESFMITEDAVKFANDYRELNSIHTNLDLDDGLEIEDIYTKKEISSSIDKWRKIERLAERSDDYKVSRIDDNAYQIEFIRNRRSSFDGDGNLVPRKPKKLLFIPAKIIKMKEDFSKLVNSQLVIDNMSIFQDSGVDLREIKAWFKRIDPYHLERTPENIAYVRDVIGLAFSLYHQLIDEELESRKRIKLSQKLDAKYSEIAERENRRISDLFVSVDKIYKNKNSSINEKYDDAVEYAKNQHFIAKEEIIENFHASVAKEEEAHLTNVAFYNKHLKKLEETQLKYEISEINKVIDKIQKYNEKYPEDKVILSDMPVKINPLVLDSENVKLDLLRTNTGVVASTMLNDVRLAARTLNKRIPPGVSKVVVLDKFRNVEDPLQRVAMLRELALINYDNDVKALEKEEIRLIEEAKNDLKKKMKKVDDIRDDAELIYDRSVFMENESRKMDGISKNVRRLKREHFKQSRIEERINAKNDKASSKAKTNKKEKLKTLKHKNTANLDNLGKVHKAKKPTKIVTTKTTSKSKPASTKKRIAAKNELTVKKNPKVDRSLTTKSSTSKNKSKSSAKAKPTVQVKMAKPKKKVMSRLSNILSFSKGHDEIDLDEIIGKKTR